MDKISLTIDGRQIEASQGMTVLEAAREAGIYIPTLCYHPDLSSSREVQASEVIYCNAEPLKNDNSAIQYEGCQLCVVAIEGMKALPTACTTEATSGMVVRTSTPPVKQKQHDNLKLILWQHPNVCLTCDRFDQADNLNICKPFNICLRSVNITERCVLCPKNDHCDLQKVADYIGLGIEERPLPYTAKGQPLETNAPFFDRDYNLCIGCTRCVRVCREVRGADVLGYVFRDGKVIVGARGPSLMESGCQFCGACVDVCPVGALLERTRKWQGSAERQVLTTCPYCGVGCQLELQLKGERIIEVLPQRKNEVNRGQACVKGRFGIQEFVHHPERLTTPLVKRDGEFVAASWEEALDLVASKLASYQKNEVAVISSAKCTNEDNYVAQKFARAVLGTNNIDHCARL
ncbi:MAG: (2Fe-2S)-binding protein [Chloroflexi bacterium]|nr:(2Fe-2S)-binding protein [Chloroflexota bacterium]